ncbi:MAG: ABC transporter ATP-binding protein [Candidatus Limnocylindrales bacterium]
MRFARNAGGPTGLEREDPPAVSVERVTKRFGSKVALDSVTVDVPPGAFLVLLGPSGSGKTTLLRCVAGIERLDSGTIAIGGRIVADRIRHAPPERRDLSMVFQDYALWPHLTAVENVRFALRRRRLPAADAARRANEMLQRVGLAGLAGRYPNELSGGEQQRVALARALAANTGLLLFDEPLSNLDANLREQLRVEISTLARDANATSMYITHDQSEAFALADVVGVLHGGHLVQVGAPQDIYSRPATTFVARFTGLAGEIPVVVAGLDGSGAPLVRIAATDGPPFSARASAQPAAGEPGRLLVRPSAVRLGPPSEAGEAGDGLRGRVADVAFRGRGYDHAVVLANGTRLVGIHDERPWSRGVEVGVTFDRAGCFFFAAESEPATTADPSVQASAGTAVPAASL